MSLFDKLLVAHLVGDLLLQTEWMAVNKKTNYRALFTHVGVYSLVILFVLVIEFGFQDLYVYLTVGIIALSHAFLDRSWPVVYFMKSIRMVVDREPDRLLRIAVDQVFHILIIALASVILLR